MGNALNYHLTHTGEKVEWYDRSNARRIDILTKQATKG